MWWCSWAERAAALTVETAQPTFGLAVMVMKNYMHNEGFRENVYLIWVITGSFLDVAKVNV